LKEICAFIDEGNIASQKVAAHVGFVRRGYVTMTGPRGSVSKELAYGFVSMNEFQGESIDFWGEPEEGNRV
jgi:hypothetical protein